MSEAVEGKHRGGEVGELSVNEIIRRYGEEYAQKHRLSGMQRRVLSDLRDCRTGALGGQIAQCEACQAVHYFAHSCRNRHCPQCGGQARAEWLNVRAQELLPVPYYHGVFTLDHVWNGLMQANAKACYELLYATVNEVLKEYGQRYLGGELGWIGVLHTWGQELTYHVHLHCILMGGALKATGKFVQSRVEFLLPVVALAETFRERYCFGLQRLYQAGELKCPGEWSDPVYFAQQLQSSLSKKWEVYLKPPFGKPETVLEYLAGYVNRIAISNRRIEAIADGQVTFSYRDYREAGQIKRMQLSADEFLRRFLQHVLPAGFVRIRYFGLWHPSQRQKVALIRQQLWAEMPGVAPDSVTLWFQVRAEERERCPSCGTGQLRWVGEFAGTRAQLPHRRRCRQRLASERPPVFH